jgi:pyruvate/2-oxoglutarate dehydrogenase complex dihydrolipoamide acyltransferase (E2) component
MSVAHLDQMNLASFAASAVRHQLCTLAEVVELLATVAAANAAALADQYGDNIEPADADEIEAAALDILAGRLDGSGWPPLLYNCVTNDGNNFLPAEAADRLRGIVSECERLHERDERQAARAEANAAAYDDVPRLRTMSRDEIRAAMEAAQADRVIVATFRVDESDMQTDYFGGRTTREVVIGFGRGRRESFAQLRKAAAAFKPTSEYGPGLGRWHAYPAFGADCVLGSGEHMYQGSRSPWHFDDKAGPLPTRAAAEAHAAARPLEPLSITAPDGTTRLVPLVWQIDEDKIEHRENYSMGGGNYLGGSRYGGWVVKSSSWVPDSAEVFSLQAVGGKARSK